RLWAVRVLTSGLAFLLCAFLVGRISEGLAPGRGAAALVTFALGTIMAPVAPTGLAHDSAALLGFGAFALAWRRRPLLAGLAGGDPRARGRLRPLDGRAASGRVRRRPRPRDRGSPRLRHARVRLAVAPLVPLRRARAAEARLLRDRPAPCARDVGGLRRDER